jgi:hypothetical protein
MLDTFVQMTLKDGRCISLEGSIYDMDSRVEYLMDRFKVNTQDVRHTQTVVNTNTGVKVRFDVWFTTSWNVTVDISSFKRFNPKAILPFKASFTNLTLEKAHEFVGRFSRFLQD